jgi:hypothetical protein
LYAWAVLAEPELDAIFRATDAWYRYFYLTASLRMVTLEQFSE